MWMPKLTIDNVPIYINDNEIVSALCEKESNIRHMVQNGNVCVVVNSWNLKQQNVEYVAIVHGPRDDFRCKGGHLGRRVPPPQLF